MYFINMIKVNIGGDKISLCLWRSKFEWAVDVTMETWGPSIFPVVMLINWLMWFPRSLIS